jgi:hypothetical protein
MVLQSDSGGFLQASNLRIKAKFEQRVRNEGTLANYLSLVR